MNETRRDFIGEALGMGATALAAGCVGDRLKLTSGGTMQGFAARPMARVRVAIVDLDARGQGAVQRLAQIPGVEIVAFWDPRDEFIAKAQAELKAKGRPAARSFTGAEGWKAMAESGLADVVYNTCRDGSLHTKITLYFMDRGVHALTEILAELPGAICDDDCWALVEASERNRVHCMMLECCNYGEYEMLALNLVRKGILGELVRVEGGYVHDQRNLQFKQQNWRLKNAIEKKGNYYPTHAIAPISRLLDINRGNRFETLVSMESSAAGFEAYAKSEMRGTKWENARFSRGDANITLIRTASGCVVSLVNDIASPQPYDRLNLVSGTRGIVKGFHKGNFQIAYESKTDDGGGHVWFPPERAAQVRETYEHPLWKAARAMAAKIGGFDNMSMVMDIRWAYCLQNGLPLDTDVYDLATWGSIVEASDRSVRAGSMPVELPDFTRGGWIAAKRSADERIF